MFGGRVDEPSEDPQRTLGLLGATGIGVGAIVVAAILSTLSALSANLLAASHVALSMARGVGR